MTAPDSELVDALESAGCTVNGNSVGCAFHDDRKASGSIYTGTDGRSRYKCHGCEVAGDAADIIARHTGRPLAEVLKEREGGSVSKARIPIRNVQENKAQPSFATVEALAKALHHKTPEAVYRYQTADGRDHLAVMRLPEKQFRQARWTANGWQSGGVGEPFPLCHQPALAGDVSAVVVVTEGEKDADALATLGIMATSAPMGADAVTCPPEKDGKPGKVDWSPLAGRTVVLFGDDDLPGRNHMARVARCLSRLNPPPMISMVRVEDHQGCKDAADLIAAHGADAVRQAIAQAVPWNKPEVVEESASAELTVVTAANLVATHSDYRKPLIEGLLREGETMNIIAAPKVGKSWLVLLLAFSVANGLSFLGRKCAQGSVLIIDNELHPETAAQRLRSVADALGVGLENVHLVSLRGQLEDLPTLRSRIERAALKVGARLIVLDALYRLLPVGASENDNAGMMQLYNEIDGIARESGASIIAIHHPEKRSCPLPVGVIDRW
jgi:hypothetical protein